LGEIGGHGELKKPAEVGSVRITSGIARNHRSDGIAEVDCMPKPRRREAYEGAKDDIRERKTFPARNQ
jgi:hypothetical protein